MTTRAAAIALLAALLAAACGREAPPAPTPAPAAAPAAAEADGAAAAIVTFRLDEGRRWALDDPTRASVGRMEALLAAVPADADAAALRGLGKALADELRTLVSGCRMEGPAHDQLHVFLGELFPRVGALQKEAEAAPLRATRAEIDALFRAFHGAFE